MEARLVPILVALLALAGCVAPSENPPTTSTPPATTPASETAEACTPVKPSANAGGGQGTVTNNPGSFTYSGQTAAATGQEEYAWQNPAPTARITWSGQVATGSVKLTALDACGKVAFSQEWGMGSQGSSNEQFTGEAGAWLLRFEFTAFTGQWSMTMTS